MENKTVDSPHWDEFDYQYYVRLKQLLESPPEPYEILRSGMHKDNSYHAYDFTDIECLFASKMIYDYNPDDILDIGSYLKWQIGIASNYPLTIVDIRNIYCDIDFPTLEKVKADAKDLSIFHDDSFDIVSSLCSIEHFGLGRYGDEFDLEADTKAISEMRRVLRKRGWLIFSTIVKKPPPCICYNAQRIYTLDMVYEFMSGMKLIEEMFYSCDKNKFITKRQIASAPGDIYMGCWEK